VVRYADDSVLGFHIASTPNGSLQDWRERLRKFGLELHPDKTRLIEFGRFAAASGKQRGAGKPETFDFHICGPSGRTANSSFYARPFGSASSQSSKS
jgi:RNA-directed DNA polymerase